MIIQVNTDKSVGGGERLAAHIKTVVESTLSHVSDHISRVEVHVSDENGHKSGDADKRCMMEARLEGHQPFAVTQHANSVDQAVDGAAEKLDHLIAHTLGRLRRASH